VASLAIIRAGRWHRHARPDCGTEEAREILRTALCEEPARACDLASAIRRRLAPIGGVELPAPERDPIREPPGFEPDLRDPG